jgi:hypothetical protein
MNRYYLIIMIGLYLIIISIFIVGMLMICGCQQPIEKEIPLSETLSQLGQCPPMCPYVISPWVPNATDLE